MTTRPAFIAVLLRALRARGGRMLALGVALSGGLAPVPAPAQTEPMPDFRLTDANPNSPRYRTQVSPRDYRLQISTYYFGAAG